MNVQLLLQEVTADSGVIAGEVSRAFNPPIPMIMSPLLRHGTFYPSRETTFLSLLRLQRKEVIFPLQKAQNPAMKRKQVPTKSAPIFK